MGTWSGWKYPPCANTHTQQPHCIAGSNPYLARTSANRTHHQTRCATAQFARLASPSSRQNKCNACRPAFLRCTAFWMCNECQFDVTVCHGRVVVVVVVERSHPHTASLWGACASYAVAVIYLYVCTECGDENGLLGIRIGIELVLGVYVPKMWLLDFGFGPITSWRQANIGLKFKHSLPTLKQSLMFALGDLPERLPKMRWRY